MSSSSGAPGRSSMFLPKSTGGRWLLLLFVIYLLWLAANQPGEAVEVLRSIAGMFSDLFQAIYDASNGTTS